MQIKLRSIKSCIYFRGYSLFNPKITYLSQPWGWRKYPCREHSNSVWASLRTTCTAPARSTTRTTRYGENVRGPAELAALTGTKKGELAAARGSTRLCSTALRVRRAIVANVLESARVRPLRPRPHMFPRSSSSMAHTPTPAKPRKRAYLPCKYDSLSQAFVSTIDMRE